MKLVTLPLRSRDLAKLSLVGVAAGDLNAERERWLGGDGELGDVEANDPDWWSADGDLAGEGFLDAVVGPSGGESVAFVRQCVDELGEAGVGGVLGCGGAELAEESAATFLPADAHAGGGVLGEVEPHQVAPIGWECFWRPDGCEGAVPGDEVEVQVDEAGGGGFEGVEEPGELRADAVGHVVDLGHGEPGEASEVAVRFGVELQCSGERIDDLGARVGGASLFEPRVPPDADAGCCGQFLAAKLGGVAPPWQGVDSEHLGADVGAAGSKKGGELSPPGCCGVGHRGPHTGRLPLTW